MKQGVDMCRCNDPESTVKEVSCTEESCVKCRVLYLCCQLALQLQILHVAPSDNPHTLLHLFRRLNKFCQVKGALNNFVNLICKSHSSEKEVTMSLIAPRRPTKSTNSQLRNHGLSQLMSAVRLVRQTASSCV